MGRLFKLNPNGLRAELSLPMLERGTNPVGIGRHFCAQKNHGLALLLRFQPLAQPSSVSSRAVLYRRESVTDFNSEAPMVDRARLALVNGLTFVLNYVSLICLGTLYQNSRSVTTRPARLSAFMSAFLFPLVRV